MSLPRVSVGKLMILIAVISLNLAALRWMDAFAEVYVAVLSMAGTHMVMLSVMALRLARSGESGSFLFGFETFGWAAVLVCLACIVFSPRWLMTTYRDATSIPLWRAIGPSDTLVFDARSGVMQVCIYGDDRQSLNLWAMSGVFVFSAPQLLIASLGGWLFRGIGVQVVVRARSRADTIAPDLAP
jgi:hypothetical protein